MPRPKPTRTRFINLLASPFLLALPVAIIIILFIPAPAYKYKVRPVSREYIPKPAIRVFYHDLNGDGVDEELEFFSNIAKGEAAFKVVKPDGCNYEQWNFPGYYQSYSGRHFCADLNKDGFPEVYVFYYHDDSVLMGAVQPYPHKKVLFLKKFITCVNKREGKIDFAVGNFQTADMNGDENKDLVFDLNAGFSKQPRKIFIYNPVTGKFQSSRSVGAKFGHLVITDLNFDAIPEIYCATSSSGNIHDSLRFPYNDYSSWFMGFDNHFNFLFPPVRLDRYPISGNINLFKNQKGRQYIATDAYDYKEKIYRLAFYTAGGKVFSRFSFPLPYSFVKNGQTYFKPVRFHGKPYIFCCNKNGTLYLYDENFHFKKIETDLAGKQLHFVGDIDGDGRTEYIFRSGASFCFTITNQNFKTMATFRMTNFKPETYYCAWGIDHRANHKRFLYKQNLSTMALFSFEPDYNYYLKYPLWVLIYGVVAFFLWFTQHMQKLQAQRKQEIEATINTLQIKTIRSQMDPHFMFNVLNGLASNIAQGKQEQAYNYILRFSKLLRSMMDKTERIDISLEEELAFVKNYLELEKFRFKEDFVFEIKVSENTDLNQRIPRMLVQLLVENAIKHGLRNLEGRKRLSIDVKQSDGNTVIVVEDNGIGRKAASKIPSGSGKGLKLIRELIALNRKTGGSNITLSYKDLYHKDGTPAGTQAVIVI